MNLKVKNCVLIDLQGMQPVFGVTEEMELMDLEDDDGESQNVGLLRDLRDIVTAPF